MNVTAIIERTDSGYYSIACDAQIGNFCLGGFGESVEEAKADFNAIVKEAQEEYVRENGKLPEDLAKVDVEYKYDTFVTKIIKRSTTLF
jgi:predicted RNase H-like HicB family nuclease